MPLLDVKDLSVSFRTRGGTLRAVRGVSFTLARGEVLGIVGESGCGKSVMCGSLMRLIACPPGTIESGTALFGSDDLLQCSPARLRQLRGDRIAMIFQDPMTSLNPYVRIGEQLVEPLLVHRRFPRDQAMLRCVDALRAVGMPDPPQLMRRYPHEFSGGMRQRVMIAMALVSEPDLLIADEPTTALDVTVQAQILRIIKSMLDANRMSVLFVTHDLGVAAQVSHRVAVMYAGIIVESGPAARVFTAACHPYTTALRRSIPACNVKGRELAAIGGAPPDPLCPAAGCPFAPRCGYAAEVCLASTPRLREVDAGHFSACVRVQEGLW